MDVTIVPNKLQGRVTPPPSKSQTHRVILAAALARGRSRLENVAISQDILATLSCIGALGAHWERKGERTLEVTGMGGSSSRERSCHTLTVESRALPCAFSSRLPWR